MAGLCLVWGYRMRGNAYPIRHVRFMCDGACAAAKRVRGWLTVVLFDTDMTAMRRAADRDRAAGRRRVSALCTPRLASVAAARAPEPVSGHSSVATST